MTRFLLASLIIALTTAGCSTGRVATTAPSPGPGGISAEEFEELYQARRDSARSHYTPADVQFMTHMIHHHAQALEMARLVPERTDNEQIRTLAARIINAQNDEIALMRRWLQDRGQPVPAAVDSAATTGTDHDAMDHAAPGHGEPLHMQMPGMLSPEEMARLRASSGAAFDRLFLTSMIRHHEGAVTMVKELFATDGAAQDDEAFKFASDAQVDQATEVARMQRMLESLPDEGPGR